MCALSRSEYDQATAPRKRYSHFTLTVNSCLLHDMFPVIGCERASYCVYCKWCACRSSASYITFNERGLCSEKVNAKAKLQLHMREVLVFAMYTPSYLCACVCFRPSMPSEWEFQVFSQFRDKSHSRISSQESISMIHSHMKL